MDYIVYVDWNNDGDFSDSGEDVSVDTLAVRIDRGYDSPVARVPKVGTATIVLLNHDKQYSPPLVANALPRRAVRIDMGTGTLFRGYIRDIRPAPGQHRERTVEIECEDAMALLDQHEGPTALQTDVYADDIISAVVSAVFTPASTSYDQGINKFSVSAERWTDVDKIGVGYEEITASQKITDACASDWGRFYVSKSGVPTFKNRHSVALDSTVELVLSDDMVDMGYAKSVAEVYNQIETKAVPRSVSGTVEVLGAFAGDNKPYLRPGEVTTVKINFVDPDNTALQIGGKDAIAPVAGTDVIANDQQGGGGTSYSASIGIAMTARADYAEVTLTNNAAVPVYITTLRVRGYPVRVTDEIPVLAGNAVSQNAYQKRKLVVSTPLVNLQSEAAMLAQHLLDTWKDPRDAVTGVAFLANAGDDTLTNAARDLELLDRVTLTETQTGLSAIRGHILAIRHDIARPSMGALLRHEVQLNLERAYDVGTPFRLDVSQMTLDGTVGNHVLVY